MEKSLFTPEHQVFVELLLELRRQAGLTQTQLAERLQETQSYVSKVERGDRRLDVIQLRSFCRALKTSLPEFASLFEKRLAKRRLG